MVMFQCSPRPALIPLISSVEWIIENSNGIEYTQLQLHEIGELYGGGGGGGGGGGTLLTPESMIMF